MSLKAKETGGPGFDPIPEGTYTAICYAVIDLGTHHSEMFNKDAHKVLIQWEIPAERIEIDRDGEKLDLPRAISKRYTMSLHKKASLRHDLEAWRGKAFSATELEGFDVGTIAGAACLLGIVHEQGKDGKTYGNISSILAMPKVRGQKKPKAENDLVVFEIPDDAGPEFPIPDTMPEWVIQTIQESKEWRGDMPTAPNMPTECTEEKERQGDDEPNMPF